MTPEQIAYVARRRSQLRYWPWLALIMVLLLAAGYGWLWQHAQININPFLVLDQFHHKTVSEEEMIMLAARGSLAMVTCGLFLLLIILLVSVALLNEQRLLRILDEVAPPVTGPAALGANAAGSSETAGAVDHDAPAAPGEQDARTGPDGQGADGAASPLAGSAVAATSPAEVPAAPGAETPSTNG